MWSVRANLDRSPNMISLNALVKLLRVAVLLPIVMACAPNNAPMADNPVKGNGSLPSKQSEDAVQWVQIMVHLNVPKVDPYRKAAARTKDPEAAKRLDQCMAQEISAVADRVLQKIKPAGATLIHRYRTLPLLALRATPEAVSLLRSMPEVMDIKIDRPAPPSR